MSSGYCANGIHYIEDAETCPRCEAWQRRRTAHQVFAAALDGQRLKAWLEGERGAKTDTQQEGPDGA